MRTYADTVIYFLKICSLPVFDVPYLKLNIFFHDITQNSPQWHPGPVLLHIFFRCACCVTSFMNIYIYIYFFFNVGFFRHQGQTY